MNAVEPRYKRSDSSPTPIPPFISRDAPSGSEGSDTDTDTDEVSQPFRLPHLRWKCVVAGPKSAFPVRIRALIDDGSHLVLIRPELADELGLKRYPLPSPEIVGTAFTNTSSPSHTSTLSEFVELNLTSIDGRWSSRRVRAVIAPSYCAQVILGLPFLSHNSLVTDYSARTCIDKRSNYDLLNTVASIPVKLYKNKSSVVLRDELNKIAKKTKESRKALLSELNAVCALRREDLSFIPVKDVDPVTAVRDRIEVLACWDRLQEYEDEMRKAHAALFAPIPHADVLPMDVTAKIKLKNAEKTIATHSYGSPKKYKEAWRILIVNGSPSYCTD